MKKEQRLLIFTKEEGSSEGEGDRELLACSNLLKYRAAMHYSVCPGTAVAARDDDEDDDGDGINTHIIINTSKK